MATSGRVIRAPNHLGDVVLALPAMVADGSDVLVPRALAPLVAMTSTPGRVIPFERGLRGWTRAVKGLRRGGYDEGVLLSAAFSAAWLLRWGGVDRLRGTATDGRSWLLQERIPREALLPHHRINQYRLLLGQDPTLAPVSHRISPPPELVASWRARLGKGDRLVGVFPGANAPARRWPAERFAEVAATLAAWGERVLVLGGPRERDVTAAVASSAPGSRDLGGATDISDLAAILSLCELLLTNDTGPMHLAGSVGTPTVTLWGPSDPGEVRQVGSADARLTGAALPCKPCFKNDCPRRGRGTLLPDAHEECMHLIEASDVIATVESLLDAGAAG